MRGFGCCCPIILLGLVGMASGLATLGIVSLKSARMDRARVPEH
jgi:hypothetical protein